MGRPIEKGKEAMKPTVLFVCYGNSCRSIMAEAMARHILGQRLRARSAGIRALGKVSADTVRVLEEIHVPVGGLCSKGLDQVDFTRVDWVINLTSRPLRGLLPAPFRGGLIDRPVPDPFGRGLDAYRASRDILLAWIQRQLPDLLDSSPVPSKTPG